MTINRFFIRLEGSDPVWHLVILQFGLGELLLHPLHCLWLQEQIQGRHGQGLGCPQGEELRFVVTCTMTSSSTIKVWCHSYQHHDMSSWRQTPDPGTGNTHPWFCSQLWPCWIILIWVQRRSHSNQVTVPTLVMRGCNPDIYRNIGIPSIPAESQN